MLQRLSYFNLIFALIYMVVYLRTGTINTSIGSLVIIIINWLSIYSYEKDNYRWRIWHYIFAAWSLYFAGFLAYGLVNIISASIEFDFITTDNLVYVVTTALLCITVSSQIVFYFLARKNQN